MTTSLIPAFLPELVLCAGALGLFVLCLGMGRVRAGAWVLLATGLLGVVAGGLTWGGEAMLFDGAYRVDGFSQSLKLILCLVLVALVLVSGELRDVREDIRGEYWFLLAASALGFVLVVSCMDILALVVSLELGSFPLYLAVATRRERAGQRSQMESAIKYVMFGVAANAIMLFGLGYLYGLTGTTSLPVMAARLRPLAETPLALAGIGLALAGLFYKLAVLPFQFWTPDVYEGASHETAGVIASLPKLGAVAVMVRWMSLAAPEGRTLPLLLGVLAAGSMFYGNLIALVQRDFKRLLGFSGIAHAGYALLGFVALDQAGAAAAVFYMTSYALMVLACFTVISRVSEDGRNVGIESLAGLHRRSPLLAATLLVGAFGLAGVPPFAGFMGKLALFTAAFDRGHGWLVVVAVINAAIAIYYYLGVVRAAFFGDPGDQPSIRLTPSTKVVCGGLIVGIVLLGVMPGRVLDGLTAVMSTTGMPAVAARGAGS
ncbi:MAG: NADH-quinone oxidoreductase subunit N [Verrucomicrobiales bacterium]|nr:NADH-quinone oxidoreductase subunit N [Verrucomicrobiales bacterium]